MSEIPGDPLPPVARARVGHKSRLQKYECYNRSEHKWLIYIVTLLCSHGEAKARHVDRGRGRWCVTVGRIATQHAPADALPCAKAKRTQPRTSARSSAPPKAS